MADPCMVYLPTCTINLSHMQINIAYMDGMGYKTNHFRRQSPRQFPLQRLRRVPQLRSHLHKVWLSPASEARAVADASLSNGNHMQKPSLPEDASDIKNQSSRNCERHSSLGFSKTSWTCTRWWFWAFQHHVLGPPAPFAVWNRRGTEGRKGSYIKGFWYDFCIPPITSLHFKTHL